ncbi:MAG: aldehyde ferredoxin oxidoreductase C-terminal domain-containing protein, partial [Candidatus Hodarchaeales archaeon]
IPVDTSPWGIDNRIIFGTGVLTGTTFPSSGTAIATFKSPCTNTLCTATSTGSFGAYLKHTGYDFLQIKGQAKSPQCLVIDEFADITLENASKYWVESIEETDILLRQKYGKKASIACIGKAAINQVTYTGVVVDRTHSFQRGGLGSVLASKNIKAIVLTDPPKPLNPTVITDDDLSIFKSRLQNHPWSKMLQTQGTFSSIYPVIKADVLPTKNCTRILALQPDQISSFHGYGEAYDCWCCSVKCERNSYQHFVALGPNLNIFDLRSIQEAIKKCDEEGLDPISTGAALASLFQIQEDKRKLLNVHLGYNWGDSQIYSLIDKIIQKTGLGDQLARGENYLYKQTSEPSPMVKGQMIGMFYYPNSPALSMDLSSAPYGANHQKTGSLIFPEFHGFPIHLSPQTINGKIKLKILFENLYAVLDSLILCPRFMPILLKSNAILDMLPSRLAGFLLQKTPKKLFNHLLFDASQISPLINRSISSKNSSANILEIGHRITLLERLFNTRAGLSPSNDLLPRYLEGNNDFFKIQNELLSSYFEAKGLNSDGLVKFDTLKKSKLLGLISI